MRLLNTFITTSLALHTEMSSSRSKLMHERDWLHKHHVLKAATRVPLLFSQESCFSSGHKVINRSADYSARECLSKLVSFRNSHCLQQGQDKTAVVDHLVFAPPRTHIWVTDQQVHAASVLFHSSHLSTASVKCMWLSLEQLSLTHHSYTQYPRLAQIHADSWNSNSSYSGDESISFSGLQVFS